jgi:hypothetical protein
MTGMNSAKTAAIIDRWHPGKRFRVVTTNVLSLTKKWRWIYDVKHEAQGCAPPEELHKTTFTPKGSYGSSRFNRTEPVKHNP